MSTAASTSRGLRAVERVRAFRETEARLDLALALRDLAAAEEATRTRREALGTTPSFGTGSAAAFLAHRSAVATRAREVVEADQARTDAQVVSADAQGRWSTARNHLQAVSDLLARRADQARAERDRKEAAELDDIAATAWVRAQHTSQHTSQHDEGMRKS